MAAVVVSLILVFVVVVVVVLSLLEKPTITGSLYLLFMSVALFIGITNTHV